MKKVLVTGASGQLGQCFSRISTEYPGLEFIFASSADLDLSQFAVVDAFFRSNSFDVCINCAAYTNVEKAEKEQEMAYLINARAVENLARVCSENECVLVHFSTDYVFNGKKDEPYSEDDATEPLNVYGASKLRGEEYIQERLKHYYIFRTSWLYSDIGNNFFNTVKRKAEAGEEMGITTAQVGTPTNAYDLARFVLDLLSFQNNFYGVFHYSNLGEATWYDFSKEIVRLMEVEVDLSVNNDYPTLATRPQYSVLSKKKILSTFQIPVLPWKDSLKQLF